MSIRTRAARDLDSAADLIELHGWLDRGGGSCNTGFCLTDALAHVVGRSAEDPRTLKRFNAATAALAAHIRRTREVAGLHRISISRTPRRTVILYNDAYLPDKATAVATLRSAATDLRTSDRPATDEGATR